VLIYEYVTGGGFIDCPALPRITSEAYAMLNSLVRDFSQNAGCEVATVMEKRLAKHFRPSFASRISEISSRSELDNTLKSAFKEVDATLIVAPETDGVLESVTRVAEESGCAVLLGPGSNAVQHVSKKDEAVQIARSVGVAVPETTCISVDEDPRLAFRLARDIGLPIVVKPQEGAGSEGVFVIKSYEDLVEALKKMRSGNAKRKVLLQQHVRGTDASVNVVSSKSGHVVPLAMNRQLVRLRPPSEVSSYEGGCTPFHNSLEHETLNEACRIVESVKGLKGYVGIDFVLTEEKPVFMEINARITTSYAGLHRILRTDSRKGAANAIIDAVMKDKLPSQVELNGYICYSKIIMKPDVKINKDTTDVLSNLEYVLSPPFPDNGEITEAFLTGEGNSPDEAMAAKSRNEKKLDRIARKFMEPSLKS
jgi:predicted ATP-grasp superfamily ATP-dependent carboligase